MERSVTLPSWLDHLIFDEMGARYCRSNSDMTVIDWDKSEVLNYLGTYFPRSYAEAYCIFSNALSEELISIDKHSVSIFDFGCGTGGEIFGLATAISEYSLDAIINVHALDGNLHALRLLAWIPVFKPNDVNYSSLRR